MSERPIEYEINDLAVRLMDGDLPEGAAEREARRIADCIGAHHYRKGFTEGRRGGIHEIEVSSTDLELALSELHNAGHFDLVGTDGLRVVLLDKDRHRD